MEFSDGTIIMKPRVLVDLKSLSAIALKTMDESMENFKKGKVSKEIEIEKYLNMINDKE